MATIPSLLKSMPPANGSLKSTTAICLLTLKQQNRIAEPWGFVSWKARIFKRFRAKVKKLPHKPDIALQDSGSNNRQVGGAVGSSLVAKDDDSHD